MSYGGRHYGIVVPVRNLSVDSARRQEFSGQCRSEVPAEPNLRGNFNVIREERLESVPNPRYLSDQERPVHEITHRIDLIPVITVSLHLPNSGRILAFQLTQRKNSVEPVVRGWQP